MSTEPIIDTTLNKFIADDLENHLYSYFWRTRKLFNDYWYIWNKTGLLDFVCTYLREKYETPILDIEVDFQTPEFYIDDFNSVGIDVHEFYDKWDRKEEFRKELETIVHQLRIPRTAFDMIFHKVFYDVPLDINWKWEAVDDEAIFNPLYKTLDSFHLEGFTTAEIKKVKSLFIERYQKRVKREFTQDELNAIGEWCSQLKRTNRGLANAELTLLVIEQMKIYGKTTSGVDDDGNPSNELFVTSARAATAIAAELPDDQFFNADAYRQRVKALLRDFPILQEFLANSKTAN